MGTAPAAPDHADLTGFYPHDFPAAALHRTRTWWAPSVVVSLIVAGLTVWRAAPPRRAVSSRRSRPSSPNSPPPGVATRRTAPATDDLARRLGLDVQRSGRHPLRGPRRLPRPPGGRRPAHEHGRHRRGHRPEMAATGRLDPLLCVLVPQGLLELTAVFLAVGTGLRPGWTVTEPGRARRGRLLALRVRGGRPSRPTQPHRGPPGCRGRRQGLLGHLMCIRQPRAGSLLTALEKPLTRSGQGGRLEQLPGSWYSPAGEGANLPTSRPGSQIRAKRSPIHQSGRPVKPVKFL